MIPPPYLASAISVQLGALLIAAGFLLGVAGWITTARRMLRGGTVIGLGVLIAVAGIFLMIII